MNALDKHYLSLLEDILEYGTKKQTRNGEVLSLFGRQIRHRMREGFPLLTTKKMAWKQIVTELLWFLRGDTNIKYLVDNDCHIWDGDCYSNYIKDCVLFDEISNSRMTRTIIGCPSSTDITSYIDPESDWGAVDYLTGEKIKYEDCDNGVIYFNQKMVKISSLKQIGVVGLRCESLHRALDESNFIYNKEEFINKIKTDDEFAKKWGELGPIYGRMWRAFDEDASGGIDQIANLIKDLKTNPDSRRLLVTAWHPGYNQWSVLPPCHYGFQVYTRELSLEERKDMLEKTPEGKFKDISWHNMNNEEIIEFLENIPTRAISLMWNQRSVDTFLGLPFNIASYGLLLEIIAKAVNMVPDELIGNLGDVHLYLNHIEQAKEQINRTPYKLPTLNINTEWWPTEGGECGVGPLDAVAVFNGFTNDNFCKCLLEEDIQLGNYQSHPTIKAPLSN